jgi:hypothetical protein
MDNVARQGNCRHWVAPFFRKVVVIAHGSDERCLPSVLPVDEFAVMEATKRFDEPVINRRRGRDPFLVAARKTIWVVEPRPHNDGTG